MIWHNPGQIQRLSTRHMCIRTLDMHTGGEPVRIILSGFPELSGTILEKRKKLIRDYDYLRKALMWEPRGHHDMYGLLPVKAERTDSHFGVIFMHNEGYSTMCGHATLAIARCAVDLQWVQEKKSETCIKIDAPCGQLAAMIAEADSDKPMLSFENVPSFVVDLDKKVVLKDKRTVTYDLAYGGAFYAYVHVNQVGLKIESANAGKFVEFGRQIKESIIRQNSAVTHPFDNDLSFLYGVIFYEDFERTDCYSRNVCIFAGGELDRSPTGSGISGRAALLYAKNRLATGERIVIQSIIGSEMEVEIVRKCKFGPYEAVIPKVFGTSHYTGSHQFWIDPLDPFGEGFLVGK